jgi:hypothetical protein
MIENKKIANDLMSSIEKLDYLRPTNRLYIGKWFWRSLSMNYPNLERYNQEFFNDVSSFEKNLIERATKKAKSDRGHFYRQLKGFSLFILFILFIKFFFVLTTVLLELRFFLFILIITGFIIVIFFLKFLTPIMLKDRGIMYEPYDEDIRTQVTKILNYFAVFLKENNLNPKDFPIELRHNDYEGLEYEEKKKGVYTAFVKL